MPFGVVPDPFAASDLSGVTAASRDVAAIPVKLVSAQVTDVAVVRNTPNFFGTIRLRLVPSNLE